MGAIVQYILYVIMFRDVSRGLQKNLKTENQ